MELKSWTWPVVVAISVLGGIVLGTVLGLGAPDPEQPTVTTDSEECPHTWDWAQWDDSDNPGNLGANIDAFTGGRDDVPEYNDCQRFFAEGTSNDPTYTDQAFAIFVSDSVATAKPGNSSQRSAVALIRAGGKYEPLGLGDEGFYCLFLEPRISGNGVKAHMAPAPDGDCKQAGAKTRDLWVFKEVPASAIGLESRPRPGNVPPVVRWGFDGVKSTNAAPGKWVHYAIVPCDGDVCYVGPTGPASGGPGFIRRPPVDILKNISPGLPAGGRTRTIDGWHDIQYLANPVASSGTVDPAHPLLVGALIPAENLEKLVEKDFLDGWQPVAEVAMSSDAYKTKLNFAATTGAGAEYNRIEACAYKTTETGTGNCTVQEGGTTSPLDASVAQKCGKYDEHGLAWRTRHYDPGEGTYTYHCVEVKPFPANQALVVPGTVRWKWHTDDEKAWFRCPLGCCLEQE